MAKEILVVLLFGVIILVLYGVLKRVVLEKININKWFVLLIAFILFLIPFLIEMIGKIDMKNNILWYILSGASIIMFLWYMDLLGIGKNKTTRNNKKAIIMKAKAKPIRAKNLNTERKDK